MNSVSAVHSIPTLHSPFLSPNSPHRISISLKLKLQFPPNCSNSSSKTNLSWKNQLKPVKRFEIRAAINDDNGGSKWMSWIPKGDFAEKIFSSISGATSSPIFQFVSSPTTFLHSVDPRIKLVWLLALVVIPARSHIIMRFGLVAYLALLSIWTQPKEVWVDQLGRVALVSGILFIMLGLGSDGVPSLVQSRTPPPTMLGLPNLPVSLEGYSYVVMKLGPLQLTRKGLSVASTSACLTFTVRNAALGIVARRINWKQLTVMETVDVFFMYVRRIFKNIFSHAEQISQAMIVRGFRGDSSNHKIYLLQNPTIGSESIISLVCLLCLIGATVFSEVALV